ncbi:hypothetical protein [Domibacillus robiginosus]|uniref:hypothetical protein n=1 Tax=Domibacillus robiginosus TaxID=1071054 RepID=UPI00067B48E6|nr:hypothetical protein [Domibacillus robiginosus]
MAKKSLNTLIKEHRAKQKEHQEAAEGLAAKYVELEEELGTLRIELGEQQACVSNPSEESLAKDAALRREIAQTELLLETMEERQHALTAPPALRASAKEIFERARTEAVADYEEKLPAALAEIEAAKAHYLYAVASYSKLKKSVNQKIMEAGREVGYDFETMDLPKLREIAWFHRGHDEADGSKYTIFEDEIRKAVQ